MTPLFLFSSRGLSGVSPISPSPSPSSAPPPRTGECPPGVSASTVPEQPPLLLLLELDSASESSAEELDSPSSPHRGVELALWL